MEAIRIHIVRETGRATDTGDDGYLVWRYTQLGHRLVEAIEGGVVSTTGTPTYVLVALIVLCVHCILFEK
jgi:hypothetical protein